MKQSNFLSLGAKDILKGLLMSVLTPVVVLVQQSIEAGNLVFDWKSLLIAGVGGGLAYLIKNFFTKPNLANEIQSIGGTQTPPNRDQK